MRDDQENLLNIIELISVIEKEFDLERFNRDEVYRFGIAKLLECIGEEVKGFSDDFRKNHSEIKWRSIIGMRNFIVHEYTNIEWDTVLDVVNKEIPVLKNFIVRILENDQKN